MCTAEGTGCTKGGVVLESPSNSSCSRLLSWSSGALVLTDVQDVLSLDQLGWEGLVC